MRTTIAKFFSVAALAAILAFSAVAPADVGVFAGNGQNLHQVSAKKVRLLSIEVTIVPGRGHFLFDGSVPGMDQTDFYCTFVLKNLSKTKEDIQVGFPVDSQFAQHHRKDVQVLSSKESSNWVSAYSFIARDQKKTYHVEFVRRKPKPGPGEFGELFTWNMSFAPLETKTLTVQYHIPMTMGLASTRKTEDYEFDLPLGQELLNIAMKEVIGYVTSTGSSWVGNVESATFTVMTEPFERYLNVRGTSEEPPGKEGQKDNEFQQHFPVRHPWWFRKISPTGWTEVEGGIQWHYKDYKPRDPIVISYFMTQLPRLPEELSAFVDQFLENLSAKADGSTDSDGSRARQRVQELQRLKELLLATYGKQPEDELVRRHVEGQVWYDPRRDFSMESLNNAQKNILHQFDLRIEKENAALSSTNK